ncbi:AGP1 [Candida pseudojiufengensis]|uniref:AGP1 n=1 Tax=Candida pseudojiufengensis TaxID=497109 RepID=UPI00222520D9|nr:AGP1 [Candida pseudojiufengensis]KAI5962946.1 AGP1 [Candida pseudojiufengensis]
MVFSKEKEKSSSITSPEVKPEDFGSFNDSDVSPYIASDDSSDINKSKFKKFTDTFRRNQVDESEKHLIGKQLEKGISIRHLILMALVTGIGTGLLVGTGQVLHNSGPLFLIVGFAIVGSYLYPTLQAAGEMAVNYSELSGGYNNYPRRFIDDSVAFAITWNYCIQWLSVISIELVTAAMTIGYWNTSINADVWVTIFYVVILVINFIGSSGYGEAEFIIGSCKVMMITGFIIMGIVVNVGGGPEGEYIGGRYWHDPGYYTNFKGLCSVFVTGSFALGQSEFVALSASEQPNPRKAIPIATKLVLYRIIVLMIASLTIVGLLVPYTSDRLMGSSGGGSHASPFVLAAALHGVKAVPSIINAVILMSVTSVASSALYSSSRTLQSLSEQGFAPSWFNYIDRRGRPLRALVVCSIIGLFSYIAAYDKQETVFDWLLAISGLSQIFTWSGICISHVRFRAALKYNHISTDALGYKSKTGVWGSYYAIIWYCLVLIAQFWIALYPKGEGKPDAEAFFQNYLGAIVLILFYVCHKLYTRNWRLYIPLKDIDINLDRTIFDEEILNIEKEEEKEKWKRSPWWKKILKFMFY